MDPIVIGIDVGGPNKGFHAVALKDGRYHAKLASKDIAELAQWSVHTMRATVIAIDAPCGWSTDGRCRPAERALMQQGIFCFATPTDSGYQRTARLLMLEGYYIGHAVQRVPPAHYFLRTGRAPQLLQKSFLHLPGHKVPLVQVDELGGGAGVEAHGGKLSDGAFTIHSIAECW